MTLPGIWRRLILSLNLIDEWTLGLDLDFTAAEQQVCFLPANDIFDSSLVHCRTRKMNHRAAGKLDHDHSGVGHVSRLAVALIRIAEYAADTTDTLWELSDAHGENQW